MPSARPGAGRGALRAARERLLTARRPGTGPGSRPADCPPACHAGLTRRGTLRLGVRALGGLCVAVAGGAWSTALAGCTGGADPAGRAAAPDSSPGARALDPDVTIATLVWHDMRAAIAFLRRTRRRHRRLAALLDPVIAAHQEHARVLADSVDKDLVVELDSADQRVPLDPARALRRAAGRELRMSSELATHAFNAESGPFARLLASMAAASAQNVVGLDEGLAGLTAGGGSDA